MLVLSRKLGEKIVINGNIEVTVVSIERGRIRLGVEAPASMPVDREEIHRRRIEFQPRAGETPAPPVIEAA